MNRRWLASAILGLGLTSAAVCLLDGPQPQNQDTPEKDRGTTQSTPSWSTISTDAWSLGQQREYTLTLSETWHTPGAPAQLTMQLAGELRLRAVAFEEVPEGKWVSVELRGLSLQQATQSGTKAVTEEYNRMLKDRVGMIVEPSGAISRVFLPEKIEPWADAMTRSALAELQFVVPRLVSADKTRWVATERDANAQYVASYQRTAEFAFEKLRSHYEVTEQVAQKRRGRTQMEIRPDGIIQRAETQFDESVNLGENNIAFGFRSTLQLSAVTQIEPAALAFGTRGRLLSDPLAIDDQTRQKQWAERANGRSVKGLLAELSQIDVSDTHGRADRLVALEALLRMQGDSAVREAAASVYSLERDQDASLVMATLQEVFSPTAQRALSDLATDTKLGAARRESALRHLGFGNKPNADTVDTLAKMAHTRDIPADLHETATLMLGSAAKRADANDSHVQARLQAELEHMTQGALHGPDIQSRLVSIDALGNSARAEVVEPLRGLVSDGNSTIRETAVAALRGCPGEEADTMLANSLLSDDAPQVRQAAASALSSRPLTPTTSAALIEAMSHEGDASARHLAVSSAVGHMRDDPHLVDALAQLNQSELDEKTRTLVQNALQRWRND